MAEADGFLGRWARRKNAALQGEALPEPVPAKAEKAVLPAAPAASSSAASQDAQAPAAPEAPPLTLQDAQQLTPESDFKPFMNRAVQPEVRNAAMKQLFSDPHFNVMDGLDIYIDDYSKPDPLPLSMLKQMTSAKFLNLFEDEEEQPQQAATQPSRVSADDPATQSVAQSAPAQDEPGTAAVAAAQPTPELAPAPLAAPQEDNAHPDLRLQPDHAARAPDAGGGTA